MLPFSKMYRMHVLLDLTPYTFDTVLFFLLQPLIHFRQDYSVAYIFLVGVDHKALKLQVTRDSKESRECLSSQTNTPQPQHHSALFLTHKL